MLYHLFEWLKNEGIKFPGSGLFQFITFRILLAVLLSLIISTLFGKADQLFCRRNRLVKPCGNWVWQENNKKRHTYDGRHHYHSCYSHTTLSVGRSQQSIYPSDVALYRLAGIIGFIDDYLKLRAKKSAVERRDL